MQKLMNLLETQNDLMHGTAKLDDTKMDLFFVPSLVNINYFTNHYCPLITSENYKDLANLWPGVVSIFSDTTIDNLNYLLTDGNIIVVFNETLYYRVTIQQRDKRSVESSKLDPSDLLGCHDGFTEDVSTNLSLIRKRLKTKDLMIKKYVLGKLSKTDTYLIYLKETGKKDYFKNIEQVISAYKQDIATQITDISILFQNKSLLPMCFSTSSPTILADSIFAGKVAIVMDNTPVSIILPASISTFTSIKDELNAPRYYTIFNRLFLISFFYISIFMLGSFIAIMNFHPTFLSTTLISNIQLTERGTTFPMFIEIVLVLALFEFYRFATSRSPLNYVQNIVIIFGGMFIGQNAINGGIVGSLVLLLASLSYISSFAITNNPHLIVSFSIFRLFNLMMSYTLGLFGFIISALLIIGYSYKQRSAGTNYLSPFLPFNLGRIINFFKPTNRRGGSVGD